MYNILCFVNRNQNYINYYQILLLRLSLMQLCLAFLLQVLFELYFMVAIYRDLYLEKRFKRYPTFFGI